MKLIQPITKEPISRALAAIETPGEIYDFLNLNEVHKKYTGKGILIAILDTGIYPHEDLIRRYDEAKNYNRIYDHVKTDPSGHDHSGHGTHVTGICAADSHNEIGIVAVAPDVQIISIKVLGASGGGSYQGIIDAFQKARELGANIINCSFGGGFFQPIEDECKACYDAGIVVICAAGNDGNSSEIMWPAKSNYTISVGSCRFSKDISYFSNGGAMADILAPGEGILSTVLNNRYEKWTGTSMATPVVSGCAALIMERHPGKSAKEYFMYITEVYADVVGYSTISPGKVYSIVSLDKLPISGPDSEEELDGCKRPAQAILGILVLLVSICLYFLIK